MPFPTEDSLPENIKKEPEKRRRRWMHVYNSVWEETKDEGKAFAAANATLRESIDFKESIAVRLTEAGPQGKEWDVVLIEEGFSENGVIGEDRKFYQRFYPKETVLKLAQVLKERTLKAFTYGVREKQDHLPQDAKDQKPYGLVDNQVGWFDNIRVIETIKDGVTRAAVAAKFYFDERASELRAAVKDAWDRGVRDYMGFSIDALGTGHFGEAEGKLAQIVDSITGADSVDLVSEAAAGGKFIRLVASRNAQMGDTQVEKLKGLMLQMMKLVMPEMMKGKGEMEMKEAATLLKEGISKLPGGTFAERVLKSQLEAADALIAAEKYDDAVKIVEALTQTPEGQASPPPPQPQVVVRPQPTSGDLAQLPQLQESVKAIENRIRAAECKAELLTQLRESKLPDITQKKIELEWTGRIFESKDLTAAITREREYIGQLSKTGRVEIPGQSIELRESERDKLGLALDGFFANEDQKDSSGKPVPRFKSFRKACATITGDNEITATEILRESASFVPVFIRRQLEKKNPERLHFLESLTSTSLAQVLGDSVARSLTRAYNLSPLQAWRLVCSDITAPTDYRTQRRTLVGGYADLPVVAQGGPYQPLASPGDDENTYVVSKYGGTEDLTEEMIANDDVGVIRRIPENLARAANRTLYKAVYDGLFANTFLSYDGVAIFDAAHGNTGTTALSSTSLTTVKSAMRTQTDYGTTAETLGEVNKPTLLLIPNELEDLAWRLQNSTNHLFTVAAETATSSNPHKGIGFHIVDHRTDATDWIACADPKQARMLEVGFLDGEENPQLFVQDQPTVGNMFTNDKLTYKIKHVWGIVPLDHRGFYGMIGVA
jgi:hypothetical protein